VTKLKYKPLSIYFLDTVIDYPPTTKVFVPCTKVDGLPEMCHNQGFLSKSDAYLHHFWFDSEGFDSRVVEKTLIQHIMDTGKSAGNDMNPFWTVGRLDNTQKYKQRWGLS